MQQADRRLGTETSRESVASVDDASAERLRAVVDAEYDFIWRSLRRLGVAERDLDDAVQQTLLTFSHKLGLVKQGSERSFLFQIAIRVAADRRKSDKRRREVVTDVIADAADDAPSVEVLMDLRRARERLDAILDRMSLDLRAVFTLFEIDQMTLTEIAELLGVPRGTVASRLRRAREEFSSRANLSMKTNRESGGER